MRMRLVAETAPRISPSSDTFWRVQGAQKKWPGSQHFKSVAPNLPSDHRGEMKIEGEKTFHVHMFILVY